MRHIFIVNPHAGHGQDHAAVIQNIEEACRRQKVEYDIYLTSHAGHATEIVAAAAAGHPDKQLVFYACGGDGTLNEVAAGLAALDDPRCALTVYPIGTGNDFVKMFKGGREAFLQLDDLLQGEIVPIDYILSDCGCSINILSVGLDAEVAKGMDKYRIFGSGLIPYSLSAVECVLRGIGKPYAVRVDGEQLDGEYTLIFVGNGRYYGGGFCPVDHSCLSDGLLDVLLVKKISRLQAVSLVSKYKAGRYRELGEYITYRQARELNIFSGNNEEMCINLDGEIVESSHLHLRIEPGRLRFVLPRGSEVLA
ncbi:MAG: diacylglycerol kinase family lipid kinase [Clostridia bacterium]|nr:diacylglycerol kinase family lipid kinase [Clostridia bacterium]